MATVTELYGLPSFVPELANFNGTYLFAKYAIYCTVRLSDSELTALIAAINTSVGGDPEDPADPGRLDPAAVLVRQVGALQDIIQHHVSTILAYTAARDPNSDDEEVEEEAFKGALHPTSLIAVTDPDWRTRGVLLISLNASGEGGGDVFAFLHPAAEAASILTDIGIGNNSWEEATDVVRAVIPKPARRPVTVPEGSSISTTVQEGGQQQMQWSKEVMGQFVVSVLYEPAEAIPISEALNGPSSLHRDLDTWPCYPCPWQYRLQHQADADLEAKIADVIAGHREHWSEFREFYHKNLIVIADQKDFRRKGVLVAEIQHIDEGGIATNEISINGGEGVTLERVAAADAVKLLVSKAVARQLATDIESGLKIDKE